MLLSNNNDCQSVVVGVVAWFKHLFMNDDFVCIFCQTSWMLLIQ